MDGFNSLFFLTQNSSTPLLIQLCRLQNMVIFNSHTWLILGRMSEVEQGNTLC